MNGPGFRGASVHTHARTPKSGYLPRKFPENPKKEGYLPHDAGYNSRMELRLVLDNWVIFTTFMYFRFLMRYNF